MAKYETKRCVIEAEQWFPDRKIDGVFVEDSGRREPGVQEPVPDGSPAEPRHFVVTIHKQRAYLDPGDWVITEPDKTHHYPCKPDIFAAKYRPFED